MTCLATISKPVPDEAIGGKVVSVKENRENQRDSNNNHYLWFITL
jgi:hypothetical protein